MVKVKLLSNVTTGDCDDLSDNGISVLEFDRHDENMKRHFEYYAVCDNDNDKNIVNALNNELVNRSPSNEQG